MTIQDLVGRRPKDFGIDPIEFMRELFPICRSITGDGARATLDGIGQQLPLQRHEVPSGSEVLSQISTWVMPPKYASSITSDCSGDSWSMAMLI